MYQTHIYKCQLWMQHTQWKRAEILVHSFSFIYFIILSSSHCFIKMFSKKSSYGEKNITFSCIFGVIYKCGFCYWFCFSVGFCIRMTDISIYVTVGHTAIKLWQSLFSVAHITLIPCFGFRGKVENCIEKFEFPSPPLWSHWKLHRLT